MTAILFAGLWPGRPAPDNRIEISESGLQLRPPCQAITAAALLAPSTDFTLEVWLTQTDSDATGNLEILGLWQQAGLPALILGQWPHGLYLHSREDNPRALPQFDRYARLAADTNPRHLAVVGDATSIRLIVNGRVVPAVIPLDASRPRQPFGGRLLLGSSGGDMHGFAGVIHAVAFYRRTLTPAELRLHIDKAAAASRELESDHALVALYRFPGDGTDTIYTFPADAPTLLIPERVARPNPRMLTVTLSPRWHGITLAWDLALNLLGFLPLGLVIAWRRGNRGLLIAGATGLALSLTIEITQFWLPGRDSSAIDLACNILGTLLGSLCSVRRLQ